MEATGRGASGGRSRCYAHKMNLNKSVSLRSLTPPSDDEITAGAPRLNASGPMKYRTCRLLPVAAGKGEHAVFNLLDSLYPRNDTL